MLQGLSWNVIYHVHSLGLQIHSFCGMWIFIIVFTKFHHWTLLLTNANLILFYLRPTLTISYHLCSSLPHGLFPSELPTKFLYAFHISPEPHIFIQLHAASCDDLKSILWTVYITELLITLFSPPTINSSFLVSSIIPTFLYSLTFNLCSSIRVRDHTSHAYKIREDNFVYV